MYIFLVYERELLGWELLAGVMAVGCDRVAP